MGSKAPGAEEHNNFLALPVTSKLLSFPKHVPHIPFKEEHPNIPQDFLAGTCRARFLIRSLLQVCLRQKAGNFEASALKHQHISSIRTTLFRIGVDSMKRRGLVSALAVPKPDRIGP